MAIIKLSKVVSLFGTTDTGPIDKIVDPGSADSAEEVTPYAEDLEEVWNNLVKDISTEQFSDEVSPYRTTGPNFTPTIPHFKKICNQLQRIKQQSEGTNIQSNRAWKSVYLNEIWLSEIPPPEGSNIDTEALVPFVIANQEEEFKRALQGMAKGYKPDNPINLDEWWRIMSNLWRALEQIFDYEELPFTIDTILELHKTLSDKLPGLAPGECGAFRKRSVHARASSVSYSQASRVPAETQVLVDMVNRLMESKEVKNDLLLVMCLGAFFFSEFLLIHPFADVNGRTARILLSMLLRKHTVVPVSLYYQGDRKLYTTALELRRCGGFVPWTVIHYVLDSSLQTAQLANRKYF